MGSICCKSKPYQPFTTIYNSPAKSLILQKLQKNSPVTCKYTCENCNKKYIFKSKNLERKIITTLPGWIHTIKNIGKNNLIIIVWSNEIFNIKKPDTYVRI